MGDSDRDNNWRSPGRGSPAPRWNTPRGGYRGHNNNYGHGGGGFSPRFANQGYQHRSPFHYQQQQNSPYCSTPINYNQHQPYRQHRPNFGGGGRGRGGRFNSPYEPRPDQQGIDAWVSPAMWEDPWKEFTGNDDGNQRSISTTQFATDLSITASSEIENVSSTSTSMLDVSDMIMKSAMEDESGLMEDGGKPLPNVSMEDLLQPQPKKSGDSDIDKTDDGEEKKEDNLETQASKDLLSLITS